VVKAAHRHDARVLVNGDEALARETGADGLHWSAEALMRSTARPADLLCAASCHTAEELERATQLECDFAVLGPVGVTASHPAAQSLGWGRFGELARGAQLPIYAIGGLRPGDLEQAWGCGAHGLAMIRGSWACPRGRERADRSHAGL
jgi:8-oxo-dGTP diphosphatase